LPVCPADRGANALLGGSNKSIALQPLSVQGQEDLNVAVGVAERRLSPGRCSPRLSSRGHAGGMLSA
jgi:hypothetical protein